MDVDFAQVKTAFLAVRDTPPEQLADALRAAVPGDTPEAEAVRAEVRSLLGYDGSAPFIRRPSTGTPRPAPPPDAVPPPVSGAVLDGRFTVGDAVAEGGFGWVFQGADEAGEPVAIKLFKPIDDPDLRPQIEAAFDREGRVLESLAPRSPHIVAYRGVGVWADPDGRRWSYIVMEWLAGDTLGVYVEALFGGGPMALPHVVDLLAPVAEALAVAHASGVAHRDVKPANVLCTTDGDGRHLPKLVDFGAAKRAADRARGFQSTGGDVGMLTVRYSAPEQADKRLGSSGPWSDVFSLALMAVELLAGRHPWTGLDLLTTMDRAADPEARPTPRAVGVEVSDAVEAVFARALTVDPKARHRDADHFWSALVAAVDGEQPSVYVPVPSESGVSIMWYVVVLVIAGGAAWWWLRG